MHGECRPYFYMCLLGQLKIIFEHWHKVLKVTSLHVSCGENCLQTASLKQMQSLWNMLWSYLRPQRPCFSLKKKTFLILLWSGFMCFWHIAGRSLQVKLTGSELPLPKTSELKEGFMGDRREVTDPFDSASPLRHGFHTQRSGNRSHTEVRWSQAYGAF